MQLHRPARAPPLALDPFPAASRLLDPGGCAHTDLHDGPPDRAADL